jgi:RimJ/RimL family protein N-acetyltransferase
MTSLDTPRLQLRPLSIDDADTLFEWCGDARVMRYYAGGVGWTIAQTRERVAQYVAHQDAKGFAKWLILDRETGQPVGDSGLMELHAPGTGWIDLGYRFKPSHWGRGLATEVARAWIQAAPALGIHELGAFVHVDNHASLNVLRKVGFLETRRDTVLTVPAVVLARRIGPIEPDSGSR